MLPTSTRVSISGAQAVPAGAESVVVFLTEKAKGLDDAAQLSAAERKVAERMISAGIARGKAKEVAAELVESGKANRHVLVVGVGGTKKLDTEAVRVAAGALAKTARRRRLKKIALVVPEFAKVDRAAAAEAIVSGFLLASFKYDEHKGTASKKKDDEEPAEAVQVTMIAGASERKAIDAAIDRARAMADGQNIA